MKSQKAKVKELNLAEFINLIASIEENQNYLEANDVIANLSSYFESQGHRLVSIERENLVTGLNLKFEVELHGNKKSGHSSIFHYVRKIICNYNWRIAKNFGYNEKGNFEFKLLSFNSEHYLEFSEEYEDVGCYISNTGDLISTWNQFKSLHHVRTP